MNRKTALELAKQLYTTEEELITSTVIYNKCLEIMMYLEKNVKTKGLSAKLYIENLDYLKYVIEKEKKVLKTRLSLK
jgi:hypothetical protein